MKKIAIIILFVFSAVSWSSPFDQNTDIKNKYEFEADVSLENEKLAAKLLRFQTGDVNETEMQEYMEALDTNETKAYAADVAVDEELMRPIDIKAAEENKDWLESMYESIINYFSSYSNNEAVVEVEDVNVTNPSEGVQQ